MTKVFVEQPRHTGSVKYVINRPGVAVAVLQTPLSPINSIIPPNLQKIINHKLLELGTCNFVTVFTTHVCNVLHVTCHMSLATCHKSCVTCHIFFFFFFFFFYNMVELVGWGSVLNGATPSSSVANTKNTIALGTLSCIFALAGHLLGSLLQPFSNTYQSFKNLIN